MVTTTPPLRVVYLGTPEFAVPTLEALIASRHPVVAVISQPDRPRGRGHRLAPTPTKVVAEARGIPVLQPTKLRDGAFLDGVRALRPDVGVVAAYGRIIPDDLLAIPRLGMINVHASLLPAWRGAAPVHRAVMAGDPETGISIMRVVSELDAGPVFAVAHRPIGPDETSPEVERALAQLGAVQLVAVVDQLAAGDAIEAPQDHSRATYAPKITRAEGTVDWSLPARALHNRVRGLQPWPLVAVRIDGNRCLLHRTQLTHERTDAAPGTIVGAGPGGISVAAGHGGVLRIVELQPEGRRAMSARDFLAGHVVRPGASLAPA
jgi:methionyl-tRNA formyltransferase